MNAFLLTIVATILLAIGAAAQNPDSQALPSPGRTTAKPGMSSGMMAGIDGMMMKHQEAEKLADDLLKSFAAIQAEKDPAALKVKLEAHGALLKELQAKLRGMMDDKMMTGGAHDHQAK
jgi:hypothetical protein